MKMIIIALVLILGSISQANAEPVNGCVKKSGVYVAPHYRTNQDNSRLNNYSTKGNYNPYTGKQGTVNPYNNFGSNLNNREKQSYCLSKTLI